MVTRSWPFLLVPKDSYLHTETMVGTDNFGIVEFLDAPTPNMLDRTRRAMRAP